MRLAKLIILTTLLTCTVCATHATHQIVNIRTIAISPNGINNNGELSGIYYDLANLIVAKAGYHSINKVAPYARIVKSLKFGDTDLTIMFRTPELEDHVDYIAPLPSKSLVVVGLQGRAFENMASLSGITLIYLRGAKFNAQIDNDETIVKQLASDFILGLKMLDAGRADAIIGALPSIQRAALDIEVTENKKILLGEPLVIDTRTPWIQISKKSRSHLNINKLRESFLQLEKADTLNTLKRKYGVL